jgi:hypothetical protein
MFRSAVAAPAGPARVTGAVSAAPATYPPPYGVDYSTIVADLTNHSLAHPENTALATSVAHLPGSPPPCPTCVGSQFLLPDAESLALTGLPAPGGPYTEAGFVAVGDYPYDVNGVTPGTIDLTGVMLHEITHVIGRDDFSFVQGGTPWLTPLNLDRYGCGTTSLTTSADNACFSINGGVTDLNQYSPASDTGDWNVTSYPPIASPFNCCVAFGQLLQLQSYDITEMNALGWDPFSSSVPEPSTWALLGLGFVGLGLVRRPRRTGLRTASL